MLFNKQTSLCYNNKDKKIFKYKAVFLSGFLCIITVGFEITFTKLNFIFFPVKYQEI